MKSFFLSLMLVTLYCKWCSANSTEVSEIPTTKLTLFNIAGRRLKEVWTRMTGGYNSEDTFIGRCFGVARKLKMMMPLLIFKLGVIVTILVFLTIFSLKSMGLLITLLMLKVGGIASKFSLLKQDAGHQSPPQNVHFHIHPGHDGKWHTAPGAPWDRAQEFSTEKMESYNLYNKLMNNPYFNSNVMYKDR